MKVSSKGQITLPVEQRNELGINPGDELEAYADAHGRLILIKMVPGAAKGILSDLAVPADEPQNDMIARMSGNDCS